MTWDMRVQEEPVHTSVCEGDDVLLQYSSDEDMEDAIDYNKFIQRRADMRRACDQPVRVDIINSSDEVHIHVFIWCFCLSEHRLAGLYALTTMSVSVPVKNNDVAHLFAGEAGRRRHRGRQRHTCNGRWRQQGLQV